jgi:DnaJ-class molecular chaperone
MDHYSTLGIDPKSSETEIKQAYRSLSFKFHPDRNKSEEASVKMREINEAYETLSDSQKRTQYDFSRNGGGNPFGMMGAHFAHFNGPNLDHIINELFNQHRQPPQHEHMFKRNVVFQGGVPIEVMFRNDSFFEQPVTPPPPPQTLEKKIDITFEDAYKGVNLPCVVEREIKNSKMSYHEEEKFYVTLPPGIDDGEIVEILEKGNVVDNVKGSIKLHIHIVPHSLFERNGLNIIYKQTLTFKESICGFDIILNNLDGNMLKMVNRKGNVIQNGDQRVIKSRGFNRDNQSGDLIILFSVTPPKALTEEQITLFESIL